MVIDDQVEKQSEELRHDMHAEAGIQARLASARRLSSQEQEGDLHLGRELQADVERRGH